jgi:hypothetical protein
LKDFYTARDAAGNLLPATTNWAMVFIWPGVLSLLCAIAYWFTFKEPAPEPEDIATETTPSTVPPLAAEEAQ